MKNESELIRHDALTAAINSLLLKIPEVGNLASSIYLWRFCTFNFMIVGASGMVLSWILYEGFFRNLLGSMFGGTFFGMMITTLLVFCWNYVLNKRWSLGIHSQVLTMKKSSLKELQLKVSYLLKQKFDAKGKRI